jgi:hypothetical protein
MKTPAIAPVALAVLAAVGGCGDSDRALSRHDFIRKANAICSEANEKVRALGPEPPILTDEQADWIEQLTKIDRTATERLDALQPPDAAKHPIASMLSAFKRGLGKGDDIARASRAGDDAAFRSNVEAALNSLTQAQASAAAYGLSECARLGRVVR